MSIDPASREPYAEASSVRDSYKREALRIPRASLDKELVAPAVKGFKTLRVVDIVYQNTAVGTSVECNAQ